MKIQTILLTVMLATANFSPAWATEKQGGATNDAKEKISPVVKQDIKDVIDVVKDVTTYGPVLGTIKNILTPKEAH